MFSQDSNGALLVTARRAKRENGGLGVDPPGKYDDLLTSPPQTKESSVLLVRSSEPSFLAGAPKPPGSLLSNLIRSRRC
jgi:hypothetical protein